jgi:exonuclease VII small subunit
LQAAAEDFTKRRADLDALARHRTARLVERADAVAEVLEAAVVRASQTIGPQAEQRLTEVNVGLAEVAQTQPALAPRLRAVGDQLAALAASQVQRAADLEAGREALGEARQTRPFQQLLRHVAPNAGPTVAADWTAAWHSAASAFDQATGALGTMVKSVDPIAALGSLAADLEQDAARLDQSLDKARQAWRGIERDLQAARDQLRVLDEQQAQELAWWKVVHAALPDRLRSAATGPSGSAADSIEAIEAVLAASAAWDVELQKERDYVARAESLVTDWARRLRAAARDPRDGADLKQIYIDNANVIGITCVQAGAYQFSRAYRNFDCVIVDEVSKATPPELLLPMLKGKRVVLVGDHKQLPPMIGPETLADLALEMAVPKSDLDHLERSLFKELFETAPPELRVMLTEQYRMHPQIMEAINQFYDGKLASGIAELDRTRAHGFQLPWLRPDNHLLWINTPSEGPFVEQRVGTTYFNAGELDVIVRLVKALDGAWAPSVARGLPPKEVGVITFYGAQVRELKAKLADRAGTVKNLRLRVGTVDRFQGMERQVIIASLVRNNSQGNVGFARKPERVNVAFSRAQELLVIVGSRDMFCERARDGGSGEGQVRAIYGRVAEVVARAGGDRRTTDVSDDFKR